MLGFFAYIWIFILFSSMWLVTAVIIGAIWMCPCTYYICYPLTLFLKFSDKGYFKFLSLDFLYRVGLRTFIFISFQTSFSYASMMYFPSGGTYYGNIGKELQVLFLNIF